MAEYIDREWLLSFERFDRVVIGEEHTAEDILMMIQTAPAADVVPVRHGRWELMHATKDMLYCSECRCIAWVGHGAAFEHRTPYCPNCGAKMDGEDDNGFE